MTQNRQHLYNEHDRFFSKRSTVVSGAYKSLQVYQL